MRSVTNTARYVFSDTCSYGASNFLCRALYLQMQPLMQATGDGKRANDGKSAMMGWACSNLTACNPPLNAHSPLGQLAVRAALLGKEKDLRVLPRGVAVSHKRGKLQEVVGWLVDVR
jgi:hypothetical protein